MPVMMCDSTNDEHAPFPHRLVIPMTTRRVRNLEGIWVTQATLSSEIFVICAHCDHLAGRTVNRCHCRERCHPNLSLSDRYRNPRFWAESAIGLVL